MTGLSDRIRLGNERPECFLAQFSEHPCEGQLVRVHLLNKHRIKKEFPKGAVWYDGRWYAPVEARFLTDLPDEPHMRTLHELQDDEGAWVPGCGGLTGIGAHHGDFDGYRLRVPREAIPSGVEEYAAELGLTWWLDRFYPAEAAAA